ncbi:MarR family transcriptional regulator [Saccharomonospora sp. NPDC046836]|uniref:GbsR/MarR family transcriptional regulator n=1 Tax=Saccharomonospora sp. NPDC046836 TaxID=3156921 RepID=UPI0033F83323
MNTMAARQQFIEDAGMFFERLGLSRTSGRVLGWLLISPDGSADAPDLCTELATAKSSMSVALRQLDAAGLIERYRLPRQRRERYRLTDDVFGRAFRAKMAELDAFNDLVNQALRVVGNDVAPRERLRVMSEMYGFMAREFPKLLDRWDQEKRARLSPGP